MDFAALAPEVGRATGFGFGFWVIYYETIVQNGATDEMLTDDEVDGPPFRSSLPFVIGRAWPGFRFGTGLDRLPADSPDGTATVWLL